MKRSFFPWTGLALSAALAAGTMPARAQSTAVHALLDRAHTQKQSGHIDLAAQSWQQVLLADPNNAEAVAGLARWSKLAGNDAQAAKYLEQLRRINPNDLNIARIQNLASNRDQKVLLEQAAHLAQGGHPEDAMNIYRQVWSEGPPDGDWALAYYDTEASVPSSRDAAVTGLRTLAKKYPQDARYSLALGRILTYTAKSRADGERILREHPGDAASQAALRQALVWDAQNPVAAPVIREYLKEHKDPELAKDLADAQARQTAANHGLARTPEENAAFAALAANKVDVAQSRFAAIHTKLPDNPRALAGLGFVSMKQGNFAAAAGYLEQAQQNGLHDKAVDASLVTSRFWNDVQAGTAALNANRFNEAETSYNAALEIHPESSEALDGLSGVYMKAGHPAQAVAVYQRMVKLDGGSTPAWRGLFIAQVQAAQFSDALTTAHNLPPATSTTLARDPEYLRNLAAAYTAIGRDADAQQVLAQALALPFPDNGRNMKAGIRLQYAALLAAGKRYGQAAGLFREILAADPANVSAWQGLVSVQNEAGYDAEAVETVERMPPGAYDAALQDTGFLSLVASVYQQQNHLDVAQGFLERAAKSFTDKGQPLSIPLQLQIAAIQLQQGDAAQAYAIYRTVLITHPENTDAWKGLMSGLHQTGHDQDALAQMEQIPPSVQKILEGDPAYLQTIASIEASTNHPRGAMQLLAQAQARYRAMRVVPPAEVDIQSAWLLYNAGVDSNLDTDRDLYRTLMTLGGRTDLTDAQRRRVQTIWATWSEHRASQAADAGNTHRALQILTAAQQAFPGNPDVTKALAAGYLRAGQPKLAMAIYQSPEMAEVLANPTATDYQGMIGTAIAVPNLTQAESWLRQGLETYPNDPQILAAAARFEQARGDNARAASYWKASLAAMSPVSPANQLAHTLERSDIVKPARSVQNASLAGLLDPDGGNTQPALPSYGASSYLASASAPTASYSAAPPIAGAVPVEPSEQENSTGADSIAYGAPATQASSRRTADRVVKTKIRGANAPAGAASQPRQRLRDYSPQSSLQTPQPSMRNSMGRSRFPSGVDTASTFAAPALPQARADEDLAMGQGGDSGVIHHPQLHLGISSADSSNAHWDTLALRTSALPATDQPVVELTLDSSPAIQFVPALTPSYETYHRAAQVLATAARPVDAAFAQSLISAPPQQNGPYIPRYAAPQAMPLPAWAPQPPATTLVAENQQQVITDGPQQGLPPLRGPWGNKRVMRQRDPREEAEMQLATIEGGFSPWAGGTGYVTHRTGTVGMDQLTILESPFEASTPLGGIARITVVTTPSFLDSGTLDGTSTNRLGTLPVAATSGQQNASGVGGELQLSATNFGASVGYTPYEFLVSNIVGRFNWRPAGRPLTFSFNRDAVKDSQLSYAGLRDPGSVSSTYRGNVWGGVIENAGNVQYSKGDANSGLYLGAGGQYLTGQHVETNHRIDGVAGAYWHLLAVPDTGDLTLGANFFGMHYANNLRYFTYGQGGYFSPSAYLLANMPVTWTGHSGVNLHYAVTGAFGLQAFQEEASPLFPLDSGLQAANKNAYYPAQSVIGSNYDIHGEVAYHVNDHWYVGGFVALNNTRDFESQSVGFFVRFLGRAQYPTELGPTGLFPWQGNRPLMVP